MPAKKQEETKGKLAVVRVRGMAAHGHVVNRTLEMLNLNNKNWCVVVENTPSILGMITRVKDYVTWGEVSEEIYAQLVKKRADVYIARSEDAKSQIKYTNYFVFDGKKYKKSIRLSPPKKGYGRNGIKYSFANGGSLGNRKEKINDLLARMI